MEDDLLTYAEVRKLTGFKLGTLYSMVKRREIPHVRLGRRLVRFRRAEIDRWLKGHAVPVAKEAV